MKITIDSNLKIDKACILDIINNHPLNLKLSSLIDELFVTSVDEQSNSESITYNSDTKTALLNLFCCKNYLDYKYILYHEFSHVIDRQDSNFMYCDEKKNKLSDTEKKLVMELWNIYIDSRLNLYGYFQVDNNVSYLVKISGQLTRMPETIDVKLMSHVSFLSSRKFKNAEQHVKDIWNNPNRKYSYDEFINIVKRNT